MKMSTLLAAAVLAVGVSLAQEQCTLCHRGDTPNMNPSSSLFPQGNISCTELAGELASSNDAPDSDACKIRQLTAYQGGCCIVPPFQYCPICPDGSPFDKSDATKVPIGTPRDPSCNEIEFRSVALAPLTTSGKCEDTFLQRGAHYCGCPGEVQKCSVCPPADDGSFVIPPRRLRKEMFRANTNCLGLNYLYSLYNEDECADMPLGFGVDHAAFCECPGAAAPANACDVCGEGFKYNDENDQAVFKQSGADSVTCSDWKEFSPFVTRDSLCAEFQQEAQEICCQASGADSVFRGLFVAAMMSSLTVLVNLL